MSEINIDAAIVQNEVSLNRSEEKLVEMSNGCICCTLREDLLVEVNKLAQAGHFDYLEEAKYLQDTGESLGEEDQRSVADLLDDCLLSEEEVLRGKAYWKTLNDPFPTWEQNA